MNSENIFLPSDKKLRQFAGLWIIFFSAIAARQWFHHEHHVAAIILAIVALTIGPMGVAFPKLIKPIYVGWMTAVYPIGWVMSHVMLGIVFFLIVTPMAILFRVLGRDALGLRAKPKAASYWVAKPVTESANYLRQY